MRARHTNGRPVAEEIHGALYDVPADLRVRRRAHTETTFKDLAEGIERTITGLRRDDRTGPARLP